MVVYNKQTGEPMKCEPVDVRELVASGAYVKEPPKQRAVTRKASVKSGSK
jgi:hypothetical protein